MRYLYTLFIVWIIMFQSYAQSPQNFQQLKPTANPAYMLLGISPTNIERPTTPKEFGASLQNAVVNGKATPNFAMEVTPFELFSKKKNKLTYAQKAVEFVRTEKDPMSVFKNISLSLATSQTDTITLGQLGKGTSAALGVKTTIFNGRPSLSTRKAMVSLVNNDERRFIYNDILNQMAFGVSSEKTFETIVSETELYARSQVDTNQTLTAAEKLIRLDFLDQLFAEIRLKSKTENFEADKSKITAFLQSKVDYYAKLSKQNLQVLNKKFAFAREGFMWDASAAYMGHFVDNSWDSLRSAKWSVWTTVSYRLNADQKQENVALIDFMGLIRYTGNNIKVDSSDYVDLGAKLQFTYNKITFSGEYIYRKLTKKPVSIHYDYTDRVTANLEYVVSNLITLKASVGRTFDGNSVVYDKPNDKIFAVGGINFSVLSGQ